MFKINSNSISGIVFLMLFLLNNFVLAQSPIISGPMIGYVEHREVLLWMEVAPDVKSVIVEYWKAGSAKKQKQVFNLEGSRYYQPVKLSIGNLEMGTTYNYSVLINGKEVKRDFPLAFTTKKLWEYRTDPPDFSFLFGSCAYINDSTYDRPGAPYGQSLQIYESMYRQPSDFTLWVGDNVYLRPADWSSQYGISYRYHYNRKTPALQPLLASRPNYATWDDHDYGPNDSDKYYELKDETRKTFSNYWGNKSYGENGKGIYSKFTWSDAEFFLVDNRYFRTSKYIADSINGALNLDKDYLGEEQMKWLLGSLLNSDAKFKFIVTGSQFVSPVNDFENWRQFKEEWHQLINFIVEHKINGVIFLSGDRHFTEVNKLPVEGFYPIYDITSSPLSSRPYSGVKTSEEAINPLRVENTLVAEQNFIKVSIKGDRRNRVILLQDYNINNELLWKLEIPYEEIRVK